MATFIFCVMWTLWCSGHTLTVLFLLTTLILLQLLQLLAQFCSALPAVSYTVSLNYPAEHGEGGRFIGTQQDTEAAWVTLNPRAELGFAVNLLFIFKLFSPKILTFNKSIKTLINTVRTTANIME